MKKEFDTFRLILIVIVSSILSSIITNAFIYLIIANKSVFDRNYDSNETNNISNYDEYNLTVVMSQESLTLKKDDNYLIEASVLNKDNAEIKWYSEDSSIASVSEDGVITANSVGETNIFAEFIYKGFSYRGKCLVTVTDNAN